MKDGHAPVRRDHLDLVRRHRHLVLRLDNGHHRGPLKDLGQHARMPRVEVGNQYESHPAVSRHFPKKLFERLQSPGRCAHPDDRECLAFYLFLEGFLFRLPLPWVMRMDWVSSGSPSLP